MKTIIIATACIMASASAWAVEKSSSTFKAFIIPLNDPKIEWGWHCVKFEEIDGGGRWIMSDQEIGLREDGLAVWKRSPEAIKDAQEREQKSKPYK